MCEEEVQARSDLCILVTYDSSTTDDFTELATAPQQLEPVALERED
jgi:hypothetical protein